VSTSVVYKYIDEPVKKRVGKFTLREDTGMSSSLLLSSVFVFGKGTSPLLPIFRTRFFCLCVVIRVLDTARAGERGH